MNWDSAIALLGSGAGVVASAVAVLTYRRQFSDRRVEPDRRFDTERTMVIAGRRASSRATAFEADDPPGYGDRGRPAYAPVSPAPPAPPHGWAAPLPAAGRPPARASRAAVRHASARLALLMFLVGLAGVAAAVAISRSKGYLGVTLPLAAVSDVVIFVAGGRMIVLLRHQWNARGISGAARAGNGFLVVVLAVAVLIGLGGAWTLAWGDYQSRVDSCVAGGWIVDSHVMQTTPYLTGKGAQLNLTADGDGVLSANNIEYTATKDGHTFRAIETFTMTFVLAAHGGHVWVDDFRRQHTETATIDGKAWEPLNGPDFAGILNTFGGYLDFTCSGSRLTISHLGTVNITAHRAA